METIAIVLKAIELLPRFLPNPKPPVFDYASLRAASPYANFPELRATEVQVIAKPSEVKTGEVKSSKVKTSEDIGTACLSCSRSHLSTVSGALNESLRFAREEGIRSPEVQRRIMMAEDELAINERIDLSAEALQKSPPQEAAVAREYLPRIRKLRQDIGQIASVEELERVAADSSILSQEFRLRQLQLRGVDLNPVLVLAKKVQAGEITMDQAKAELKKILPEE